MDTLIPHRYRKPPPAYTALCDFCDFTRTQQQELWSALTRATWLKPTGWRQHLWWHENTRFTSTQTFLHRACAPASFIEVIDHLEREKLLTHVQAIALQELILNATDTNGRWCDHKSPKPVRR
jgi:hypothetical protein